MSLVSKKDIENFALKNKNIDVIAMCITPFHFIGIRAYVKELYNKMRKKLSIIVYIIPHAETGFALGSKDIVFDVPTQTEIYFQGVSEWTGQNNFNKNFNERNTLYAIFAFNPDYLFCLKYVVHNLYRQLRVIIIDDGLGSYNTPLRNCLNRYLMNRKKLELIKSILKIVLFKILFLFHRSSVIKFTLINNDKTINHGVVEKYKQILGIKMYIPGIQDSLLLLPSLSSDLSCEELYQENMLFSSIKDKAVEKNKLIFVKPHPRDHEFVRRYTFLDGCMILNKNVAIEELISEKQLYFNLVIGKTSTALLTLKIFYDFYCVSIDKLIRKNRRMQKIRFERFEKLIGFPESIEQMSELISSTKSMDKK